MSAARRAELIAGGRRTYYYGTEERGSVDRRAKTAGVGIKVGSLFANPREGARGPGGEARGDHATLGSGHMTSANKLGIEHVKCRLGSSLRVRNSSRPFRYHHRLPQSCETPRITPSFSSFFYPFFKSFGQEKHLRRESRVSRAINRELHWSVPIWMCAYFATYLVPCI